MLTYFFELFVLGTEFGLCSHIEAPFAQYDAGSGSGRVVLDVNVVGALALVKFAHKCVLNNICHYNNILC